CVWLSFVVPVRGHAALAARCVASVLASRSVQPCEVIVVGDADALRDFPPKPDTGSPHVTVSRQDRSLDYAGLLNRAFALHGDRDVVVLQADAEVAGNWLDPLRPPRPHPAPGGHRTVHHAARTRARSTP